MEEINKKIEKETREEYKEKPSSAEAPLSAGEEKEGILEKREFAEEEIKKREELEKEIEKIKLSPQIKAQAQKQADEIKKQSAKGKIQHLLDLAQAQGISYAVEVARKIDDPYLLDLFHDTLAKEGLFKKFMEK